MKKGICLIVGLLLLVSLLHAGGSSESGTGETAQEQITLRFQDHSNESRNVFIRKALEVYEKDHPSITIKFEEYPWGNIREKVLTQAAGNDLPDVTYLAQVMVTSVAKEGILTELDPLVERDAAEVDIDDFIEASLSPYRIDGKLYGLTSDFGGAAIFGYNKRIFDSAGTAVPDEKTTMDEFVAALKKVSKDENGDGKSDQWGLAANPTGDLRFVDNFLKRNDGSIFLRDAKNNVTGVGIDSLTAIRVIQGLADLHHVHDVAPAVVGQQVPRFEIGKAGLNMTLPTSLGQYKERLDFPWGFTVLPRGGGKNPTASFIYCACYAMPVGREHPEEAWDLLKWMTSSDGLKITVLEAGFALPPRKSLMDDYEQMNADINGIDKILLSVAQTTPDVLHPGALNPYFPEVNSILRRVLEDVALGNKKADAAIAEAMPQIKKVFE
jgi:multiple sugar transport system substrate-binding protein